MVKKEDKSLISLEEVAGKRQYYKNHPCEFITEMIGLKLAYHQKKMINAIVQNDNVTIASSNAIGKSMIFSALAVWFFYCYLEDDDNPTIVIFTAPSFNQCRENVYNNVLAHIERLESNIEKMTGYKTKFFGNISKNQNLAEIRYGKRNYIMGVSTDGANKNVGKHGKNVLCIFDEAQGIDDEKYSDFNGITMSGDVIKQVMIGNTTLPFGNTGRFYDSFRKDSGWYQMIIPCFDTPNFINPDIRLEDYTRDERDPLYWRNKLDKYCGTNYYKSKQKGELSKWNRDVKKGLGFFGSHLVNPISVYDVLIRNGGSIDSYEFKTRCRAEFPNGGENSLILQDWIEQSFNDYNDDSKWQQDIETIMGVDIAQATGSGDKSAIAIRNGNKVVFCQKYNLDIFGIVDVIKELTRQYGVTRINIELDGVGRDKFLLLQKENLPVYGVQSGGSAGIQNSEFIFDKDANEEKKKTFQRKRDEVWWNLREMLNPKRALQPTSEGKLPLLLPRNNVIREELSAMSYVKNPKIKMISKDDLRNVLGRSTDLCDAIIFSCVEDGEVFNVPSGGIVGFSVSNNYSRDY